MEENQYSRTALMTAYVRGYHAMNDDPKIFDDFLAYRLIPERVPEILEKHLVSSFRSYDPARAATCPDQATALAWSVQASPIPPIVLGRARYAEDGLEKAVRQGVTQYVILGAGMDTFAFRRPKMLEQLQVYEVDHPATQALKRRRLVELGWEQPEQLHFVPVDFMKGSLEEALTRSSYDSQTLSFFSWLGVTMYLTRDAVFATLNVIANIAPAGSIVVFDYLNSDAFIPERAAKRIQVLRENLQRLGEPMNTGFDPLTLASDLARLGLRLHEDLSPNEIEGRYFQGRTDDYHASEHAHFAWAVVA